LSKPFSDCKHKLRNSIALRIKLKTCQNTQTNIIF
jgi:hypothetical protein